MAMSVVQLVHWKAAEAEARVECIRALGYAVACEVTLGPAFLRRLRENLPLAVVIDLDRLPSQGRDLALQIRKQSATRFVPLVFVGGDAAKVSRIRNLLPDAIYSSWADIDGALREAMANPPTDPVVPDSVFAAYASKQLPQKLGIKAQTSVVLISAPRDFRQTLGALPDDVQLQDGELGRCDLTIWFLRTMADLVNELEEIVEQATHGPIWLAWPKQASGVRSDLTQQVVRKTALAAGLVDYKVCSIDRTWSGLLFKKR